MIRRQRVTGGGVVTVIRRQRSRSPRSDAVSRSRLSAAESTSTVPGSSSRPNTVTRNSISSSSQRNSESTGRSRLSGARFQLQPTSGSLNSQLQLNDNLTTVRNNSSNSSNDIGNCFTTTTPRLFPSFIGAISEGVKTVITIGANSNNSISSNASQTSQTQLELQGGGGAATARGTLGNSSSGLEIGGRLDNRPLVANESSSAGDSDRVSVSGRGGRLL